MFPEVIKGDLIRITSLSPARVYGSAELDYLTVHEVKEIYNLGAVGVKLGTQIAVLMAYEFDVVKV